MALQNLDFKRSWEGKEPFLVRLSDLFCEMDRAYEKVAEQAGFLCRGCGDNCCETRFHHHTLLEVFFLFEGFLNLPKESREKIQSLAGTRCREMESHDAKNMDIPFRGLCPLSDGTLCLLYHSRPMVCRLHGVFWKMQGRGGEIQGPGCDLFEKALKEKKSGADAGFLLDRTDFYRRFSLLEQEFRSFSRFDGKIKMTIAEIFSLEEIKEF
ncbi:YkgJ family cysteine cluster protein [Desulfococcaceae bacterium OttesenSCG-928-F15]|nr:YkgJ family cysteine cluster protein [Desulfococcaceae bacterium OttesenSCG-928-F15]